MSCTSTFCRGARKLWILTGLWFTAIMWMPAMAQVHIRESATITPVDHNTIQAGEIHTHSVRFEFFWSAPVKAKVYFTEWRCHQTLPYDVDSVVTSGNSPVILNFYTAGGYQFQADLDASNGIPKSDFGFKLFEDDSLVDSGLDSIYSRIYSENTYWGAVSLSWITTYYSRFGITMGTSGGLPTSWSILHGGSSWIQLQKIIDCSAATWSSSKDRFILSIISGNQFASFYTLDRSTYKDVRLGTEVNTVGDSVDNIWLEADGAPADPSGDWIVVQSQSNGLTVQDSVFLEPSYLDHFKPYFYPFVQHLDELAVGLEPLNMFGHYVPAPDTTRLDVTLDSLGAKYGSLAAGSKRGEALTNVEWDSIPGRAITYIADGDDPQQPTDVTLHITVPGENVKPLDVVLTVQPQPVIVTVTPAVLSPGDTATITVKQRNADGSLSDFSSDQQFEIGLSSGENDGSILLSNNSTGGYFSNVSQPFRFIAANKIEGDSAVVMIRVGTQPPMYSSTKKASGPNVVQGVNETNKSTTAGTTPVMSGGKTGSEASVSNGATAVSQGPDFEWSNFGIGKVVIKSGHTILLGQTQYYEALADKNDPSKLDIQKIDDPSKADADRADADFTVQPTKGNKVGVYWEKMDKSGTPLQFGLIRLVGRYWQAGTTYEVTLTASTKTAQGSIDIEVKKPRALLSPGQKYSYDPALDVYNHPISIDALCIKWGGQYGIPPQFLKGQIYQEAEKIDHRFWPTYRYEPWQDLRFRKEKYSANYMSQPYWVTGVGTPNPMGTGAAVPTTHSNVRPILSFSQTNAYPTTPMRIGDYVAANLGQFYRGGGLAKNFKKLGASNMVQLNWRVSADRYRTMYKTNPSQATELANADMESFLKLTFTQWTQTRKAASYGFLQVLYTTAITTHGGYPHDDRNPPENLNDETNNFRVACNLIKYFVTGILKGTKNNYELGEWKLGLEGTFKEAYRDYNGSGSYGLDVLQYSKMFEPVN